jgi:acyl carrier protein
MPRDSFETSCFTGVVDSIRASARLALPSSIEPQHRFVDDLGYDSLGLVTLSVALEERFGVPILLDGWIGSASSPSGLTVGSLSTWIASSLAEEHGTAARAI